MNEWVSEWSFLISVISIQDDNGTKIRKVKLGLEAQVEEEGLESPYWEMSQGVK